MTQAHLIAKNTSFLISAHIFNALGRILFSILLARYLGVINLGDIFFALVFIELFNIITDFGLGIIVTREVALDKALTNKYLSNTLILKLFLSFVSAFLVVLFINILPYGRDIRLLVYILIPTIFFNSILSSFIYIFRAYQNMKQESVISLISNFFYILLGLLAIYLKLNVFFIVFITTVSSFFNFCLAAILYSIKYQPIRVEFELKFARRLMYIAFPVGIGIVLSMVFSRADVILLSLLKGPVSVGLYAAAYKPISAFLFAPFFLATSMFPIMSSWKKQEKTDELRQLIEKIIKVMMIIIIPAAVFVSLESKRIVLIIYGNQFIASAPVLGILVWYLAIIAIAFIFTHLLCLSHTKEYALFNFITLIVNVSLNLILIPILDIVGVAITAVISALVLTLLSYWKINTGLFRLNLKKIIMLPAIASLGIVGFVLNFATPSLLTMLAWSVIIYLLILYLIRGITKQELMFLGSLLRSK